MDEFLAAIGGMRAASGQAASFEGAGQQGHADAADDQCPGDDVPRERLADPFGNFPPTAYDKGDRHLGSGGHGGPAGYINHIALTAHDGNMQIFGIWEPTEALGASGPVLMPILGSLGAGLVPPAIAPMYSLVEG